MAQTAKPIEKDGLVFYAAMQIGFNPKDEAWAIGKREFGSTAATVVEVYDKKEDKIYKNCLLHFVADKAILEIDGQAQIDLKEAGNWIDATTPRYYFTNTNYD